MNLESIIGLEIHVQLKTKSKMFCDCPNGVDDPPNAAVCPICMGHPGTLPVPNKTAIDLALLTICALNGTVSEYSKFDRKNYFYPDLPKGYQISQYDQPIGLGGYLDIVVDKKEKRINLIRIHLEEDAAKLIHEVNHPEPVEGSPEHRRDRMTLIDFNRSGTPLIEIVTQPDFRSPQEAKTFLQELRLLLRYLGVSDADMERGQMRCDANISLRPTDHVERFYTKTEIKNMNSFRAVERALAYEIQRQTKLWNDGKRPAQQATRGWNDVKHITEEQRIKEEAHDYRYFPEPDIPPLSFSKKDLAAIRRRLPELPQKKRARFGKQYAMDPSDTKLIVEDKALADWTEHVISELRAWLIALEGEGTEEEKWKKGKKQLVKLVTGWITSKLFTLMNEKGVSGSALMITPENFAEFIVLIYQQKINSTTAQEVLRAMFATGVDPSAYIEEKGLEQMDDETALETIISAVITEHDDVVATYKKGKEGALQFLIGQVMKRTKGKAHPTVVGNILKKNIARSQ